MDRLEDLLFVPSLERATHAVALLLDRALSDLRMSQAEAHVLAYLALAQHCSINDLHTSFGHKRSTLTSVLDRLEQRGWVRRAPHPTSRRLVMVHLTDDGRRAGERVSALLRELEDAVLARTGTGDVEAFLRVIKAIEEAVG
jgi:DNA-binding MarR family transcriptional regulator